MPTRTHTRTHVEIRFANPHLICDNCRKPVSGWHNPDVCGCNTFTVNVPCCCRAGTTSTCPSWSPVDGCRCAQQLGAVDHAPAPEVSR